MKAVNDKDQSAAFDLALFYQKDLKDKDKAIEWYKKSYNLGSGAAAYNLGNIYNNSKNYQDAITWYKKAYEKDNISSAALNLGLLYKGQFKDYGKAKRWYKKAYEAGNMGGANGLGTLYYTKLKDEEKAIYWYKEAAKKGHRNAINNLGRVYRAKGDNITATAYILEMAYYDNAKKQVLDFLKNDWKIDRETLKKAYKLQLTLDIPKHYTGGID